MHTLEICLSILYIYNPCRLRIFHLKLGHIEPIWFRYCFRMWSIVRMQAIFLFYRNVFYLIENATWISDTEDNYWYFPGARYNFKVLSVSFDRDLNSLTPKTELIFQFLVAQTANTKYNDYSLASLLLNSVMKERLWYKVSYVMVLMISVESDAIMLLPIISVL